MPVLMRASVGGFPRRRLRRTVEEAMRRLGLARAELSLTVVGDADMIAANRRFFGKAGPTDVIAVSQMEGDEMPGGEWLLGDVIVSWDAARRQAARYRHSAADELGLLAVHGLLHTLGMEDRTAKGRRAMSRQARRLIRKK
ncbi:MAG: rRNA maturation RNase YbeY [Candidatus Lindowbacteria bacterium RIFCSPLOWO2_12_FULL_62_27]|nr:MAG: rRNA maturation RNase YbeY [Candidatus Lindowbacteria bacterium RIFCSPLOWO2_12_FULL_62_27]